MAPRSTASPSSIDPPPDSTRRTAFTPPPAELSGFLAIPREPETPGVDACGKRFYMEMDWADHGPPSTVR